MENNTALKPRLHWIDVLKGIGIIFVMLGHINSKITVVPWIYMVPAPLFFALSGFIFSTFEIKKNIPFKEFLVKRLKSLIVPFIFFRLILVVWWLSAAFESLIWGRFGFCPLFLPRKLFLISFAKRKIRCLMQLPSFSFLLHWQALNMQSLTIMQSANP